MKYHPFIIQDIGRYNVEREILFIGPKMEKKKLEIEYMQLKCNVKYEKSTGKKESLI